MGRWHARAIRRARARVTLVVDPDQSRARALAARHRGAAAIASIDEARPGTFDTVHVCSPVRTHEAIIRWAARAGAHVLCEKPLAETGEETRNLLAEMTGSGLVLCPVHQVLFQRGVQAAFDRARALRALHVDVSVCSAGARTPDASAQDDLAAEILSNPLALIHRWLQPGLPDLRWRVSRHAPGEWRMLLEGAYPGTSLLVSSHGRPPINEARIIGEGGTAHLDLFHGFATFEPPIVSRARKAVRPLALGTGIVRDASLNLARRTILAQSAYPGLWELVRDFYACLLSRDAPLPVSPEETIAVADARDAILDAAGVGSR
jgi:predicted dehydrogenase